MEIKKYIVKIKSISPLLWNVMKREIELEKKKLKKNELSKWEENNWRRKAEIDKQGIIIIPPRWIRGMMIDACKKTRVVPHFATRKSATYTSYMESCMFEGTTFKCKSKELEPFGSFVGAQGKNSSTKVWRIRPMVSEWETSFTFIDPAGRMTKEEFKTILEYGGMFVGLGDARKLNYGRFEIVDIKELK